MPLLLYHAIDDHIFGQKELFVSPGEFEKQMKYLYDQGYTTLTFSNIHDAYQYKKPILITFDDGYRDVYQYAYPILKKFHLKATVFLVAGLVDNPEFITRKEIREMSDVFSFESHTLNHPKLDSLNRLKIEEECKKSKEIIEGITGKTVNALSFPYGRYNKDTLDIAKKYYKYGVTTNFGTFRSNDSKYEIKRIYITLLDTMEAFKKKIQ